MTTTEEIIDDYRANRVHYLEFIDLFKSLAQVLIAKDGQIGLVQISGHLKSVDQQVAENEVRHDGGYPILSDQDNLMALRVVTFYEKEVDFALKRLTDSFEVVGATIDPGANDPETFGYAGSSLVLKLGEDRLRLEEYQRFADFKIEVQVYSLFQDTWSKIQRHIGYPADQFPKEHRREFVHLSYMLELADSELNIIHQSLTPYSRNEQEEAAVKSNKARIAQQSPQPKAAATKESPAKIDLAVKKPQPSPFVESDVAALPLGYQAEAPSLEEIGNLALSAEKEPINQDNIDTFILSNELVRHFDKLISETYNTRLMYQGKNIDPLCRSLIELTIFQDMAGVEEQLFKKRQPILNLAIQLFGPPEKHHYEHIPKGISLFMLAYHTIAATRNIKRVQEFLDTYSFDQNVVNKNSVLW
ncbi:MAG: hypothetical protein HQL72_12475 [Magnetococcales bacterium]|nr:hypothetical protein [Magnetococcales bacterium]